MTKYNLARRLCWKPESTYLCSVCRTRHDASFFTTAEQKEATSRTRKCIGHTGGVLLLADTFITFQGIDNFLFQQGERNLLVVKGADNLLLGELAVFPNPICFSVNQANHIEYSFIKGPWDCALLHATIRIGSPLLNPFVDFARHADPGDPSLPKAWHDFAHVWDFPMCAHHSLSNAQTWAQLADGVRIHGSQVEVRFADCETCCCEVTMTIEPVGLRVSTKRSLQIAKNACKPPWIHQLHAVGDSGAHRFGGEWNLGRCDLPAWA